MIRRWFWALGFGIVGFASVLVWGAIIDPKLCTIFVKLCIPRAGECVAGFDGGCPDTVIATLNIIIFIFPLPPILFAVLGYFFSKKFHLSQMMFLCIIIIIAYCFMTFTGMRVLHIF